MLFFQMFKVIINKTFIQKIKKLKFLYNFGVIKISIIILKKVLYYLYIYILLFVKINNFLDKICLFLL